eukprot:CAMPEP_0114458674 /NCGR_PEP_ID=MMETSP0104-20121206/4808_1 /TAXON_ID=37642 ORGANISM="Paraphysomonas imperforata, Strain PA2" /NCGR_SAMPLE_ID=MMETSP0104 /ASSEMBLY_ACC=CAM_ASM_000202 /LENGTH=687 /DNA_ID=CAMNT_0001631275 /DNA_START=52 /DNA_END=2116 /DNA_ORIENTATION=+
MDEADLEVLNTLPHYDDHSGAFRRKFGSYQGDLVLLTDFLPSIPTSDIEDLSASMNDINSTVEDDFIFDYRGTFVCPDMNDEGKTGIRSMVLFPEGGLLSGIIYSDIKLGWSFRIQIAINIARVLCHLHNNSIIHNDIHPQALALDSEWCCKLLDMFYAVRVEDMYSPHTLVGLKNDTACAAPEVHSEGQCTAASDIYSFGLCLFEICSRVPVSSIHKNQDLYCESAADVVLEHLPDSIPDSLRELIRQMLGFEAEYRPTIEDVLDWLESLLTETCLEDDPPLPPLPQLPFPERRKSARLSRGTSFRSPEKTSDVSRDSEPESSPDRRQGRGGGYAISKTEADRLKNIAKQTRESESGGSRSDSEAAGLQSETSISSVSSNIVMGLRMKLKLLQDNLPFYKNKFFFFKENNLVWCSEAKLREQPERLHYFDLSTARVVESGALNIHLEINSSLASDPLPGQPRKKMFRSSRVRERLLLKFSSAELSAKWWGVLKQEINVTRCKMCRVKLDLNSQRASQSAELNDCFCSPVCANYYVATTARGMQLSGKALKYSHSLRLSQTDMKALDKKVIARRNPKTWKRILKKQGSDLSHGIAKEVIAAAVPLPQSVEEWLKSLGLEKLLSRFVETGYDCIGHIIIAGLREEDMSFLKIEDKRVKLALMQGSKSLGETYIKNRKYFLHRDYNAVV